MPSRYVVFALLGFVSLASAQPPGGARLRGETEAAQTRKRIAEAQQKIAAGQPAEAADELQRILEESGNDLVLVKDNNFQPARRLVQLTLAGLPTAALKNYRDRLEAPAKKLLDAGVKNRDAKPLLELRDRYFIARPTEKALDLLGELHFERGEFADAERCWRTLLPASDANELTYPQPAGDSATYRAKAILAAFAAGDTARAKAELTAFAKDYPQAKGRLAGSDGPFAETLAKAFQGGAFGVARADPLPRFPAMRPMWKTPIPKDTADRSVPRPASFPAAKTLAFHPIIQNGFAYIADAARIIAFDLKDGTARVVYDLRREKEFNPPDDDLAIPHLNGAAYTLTISEGKLYARLGSTAMPAAVPANAKLRSVIVAFEVQPGGNLKKLRQILAPNGGTWEGSPVVEDGSIFTAYRRVDDRGRVVHGISCHSERPWDVEFAECEVNQTPRHRQELLTLAGSKVAFTTHTGLTIALERASGRIAWAFRNPPAAKATNAIRDLCPPVYASGRVFIAPTDGDRIFALDAESGRLLWQSAPGSVQQLLGVTDGKLIAAMSGPQKGIRGYSVSDGSAREPYGWQNHDDPFLATYGQGITAGNAILWPTMEKLYRMNPADGSVQSIPKPGPHGNLAFGEGMLIVTTPTEVWAYEGIPGPTEPERTKPPAFIKIVEAAPSTEFDPLTAPSLKLPVKFEKAEIVPFTVPASNPGMLIGNFRIGFTGERQLVAVDHATGEVAWGLDSLGRVRTSSQAVESSPSFAPNLLVADTGVWVQTSQGERWFVDAKSGKLLHREKTAEVLWRSPPMALPLSQVAFSDGPGLVRCFDANHRKHWSYEAGGPASLTGEPPQAHRFGNALFVAVHRNYGFEIQRLDPNSGRGLWRKPILLNVGEFDWNAASTDRDSLFIPHSDRVAAFDLATGRERWWAELPALGPAPRVVRGRHTVFAYSSHPMLAESIDGVLQRVSRRSFERPRVDIALGGAGTLVETALKQKLAVAAFDPATGQPQGFQEFPCGPGATLEFTTGKLAVRSPGTVSWWSEK